MSTGTKWDARDVRPWARVLHSMLAPACEEIVIAGSLRRELGEIGDIEIVILPKYDTERMDSYSQLNNIIDELLTDASCPKLGEVSIRALAIEGLTPERFPLLRKGRADGLKYKQFLASKSAIGDMGVDLFIATPANFGNTLVIRTGGQEFSQAIVSPYRWDGLMPNDMVQTDGHLYRFQSIGAAMTWRSAKKANDKTRCHELLSDAALIPCRTECDFFNALGLPFVPPKDRAASLRRLRQITNANKELS